MKSSFYLDEFLPDFVREGFTSRPAVLQVELDRLADFGESFLAGIALADAAGNRGDADDVGQALINDQIAAMAGYALFIGIMWNRIGTPTPRVASGTVEEFERAAAALKKKGQPEIWFYFKQAPLHAPTEAALEQKRVVLQFRKRIQRKGLTWEFTRPREFRDVLRTQLTLWLAKRSSAHRRARAVRKTSGRKPPSPVAARPARQSGSRKASVQQTPVALAPRAAAEPPKKAAPAAGPTKARARKVTNSGAWMLLDEHFFRTKSHAHRADGSICVRIAPREAAEEALLRSFQRDPARHQRAIRYAYQNDAGLVEMKSVESESTDGKMVFVLNLRLDERFQGNAPIEMSIDGYSADKLAEMRAPSPPGRNTDQSP